MTLEEYRYNLLQEVKISAEYNRTYPEKEFVLYLFEKLVEAEDISDTVECYHEGFGKRRRKIRFDGYSYDDADNSIALLYVDYDGAEEMSTLTGTQLDSMFQQQLAFVEEVLYGDLLERMESASPAYDFGLLLREKNVNQEITKFKLYVLTDKKKSNQIISLPSSSMGRTPVEFHVWDIQRFFEVDSSKRGKENISIDITDFCQSGLNCLRAFQNEDKGYVSYLAIVPGEFLADLYLQYGSKLLEGNVRSFLSVKGNVNKGIRTTILSEPHNFFTYNNGIAVTASHASIVNTNNGLFIKSIDDMQIINGAQTTASLASCKHKDKADLGQIYVPMKLTVVEAEYEEKLIPNISKFSNSQNKVSEADFFSSHPFHVRIEQLSRREPAPAVGGNQYMTIWYYERTRGQYLQEQMKMTIGERRKFQLRNPKAQLITKTDLAKYINTYNEKPHIVSLGAQRNMRDFATHIDSSWNKNDTIFNRNYFKKVIVLAIIFRETEKMVFKADWYEQGYRANIVTYAIAKLFHLIRLSHQSKALDINRIWQNQKLYLELSKELIEISYEALQFMTDSQRPIQNVTEWCKKAECWTMFSKTKHILSDAFEKSLIYKNVIEGDEDDARKTQMLDKKLDVEYQVVELGGAYWEKLLNEGRLKGLLNPTEISILSVAAKMEKTGRVPSSRQAKIIMEVKKRLYEEGVNIDTGTDT